MKIYTRGGDAGETGIWGGVRLAKDDLRIEAMGSVDECNATIGIALAVGVPERAIDVLVRVQNTLFVVGSDLMAPQHAGPGASVPRVTGIDVADLERVIDEFEADLPDLRNFILPGGSLPAAHVHFARTACRRAERQVTALARVSEVSAEVKAYLNRLSDLLFVIARFINSHDGNGDIVWVARSPV